MSALPPGSSTGQLSTTPNATELPNSSQEPIQAQDYIESSQVPLDYPQVTFSQVKNWIRREKVESKPGRTSTSPRLILRSSLESYMRELGLDQAKDPNPSQLVQVQDYSNQLLDELRSRVESLEKQLGIKDGQINRLQDMNEKLNQVVENSQVLLRLTSEKQAPEMPGEKGFVTVVDNQPSQAQKTAENENNKVKEEKPWWKGLFN